MRIAWLDRANPDGRDVAGAVAVAEAARAVEQPHRPVTTVSVFLGRFRHGWDGEPPEVAVARDGDRYVGVMELGLPKRDNTHLAIASPLSDPAANAPDVLKGLIAAAAERAMAAGRNVLLVDVADRPEYASVASALGFEQAYVEIERRQDLSAVDWSALDAEYALAEGQAAEYELLRIAPAVPDGLLDAVARLTAAINDAPTEGLHLEDEVFTADRIRAFDSAVARRNRRLYRLVARDRASGELAGHTVVAVESEQPWQAYQYDTSVLAGHRGHRLGLLLKIGMMRWLREAEPQVRFIDTTNAASNDHMIRVNERLGYKVVSQGICWQKRLD